MKKTLFYLVACGLLAGTVFGLSGNELQKGFENPPDSARPHVWWHWMNGNVTKEGITADLEAMKYAGIGGAQIFGADCGIPHGPIMFNSPEWIDMVKWAATEAQRLGIELCVHNCGGWSSSGGPWNKPENAMKFVVYTEAHAKGPAAFGGTLAQPENRAGFYEDIAVLAFKTPAAETATMEKAGFSLSTPLTQDAKVIRELTDGDHSSGIMVHKKNTKAPVAFLFSFNAPYSARECSISIMGGGAWNAHCGGKIESSEDGKTFKALKSFSLALSLGQEQNVTFAPTEAKYYRVTFTPTDKIWCKVTELRLSGKAGLSNLPSKTFRDRGNTVRDQGETLPSQVVQENGILNLTKQMDPNGRLNWNVPEGEWTILRMGYAANGRHNHPASPEGTGPECDKLSKVAMEEHFAGYVGKLVEALGPLAGNVKSGLNNVLIDSYEVGTQNWTQNFADEFKARRGYDITPFLPVLAGRVVDSFDVTERFLWDYRRTIADLFAENYAGEMAKLAHKAGLKFSCEPYGNCPSDDLQYGQDVDIPMGEFWPGEAGNVNVGNAKLPASMAHVWGRKYVGAESFTASPEAGKWLKDPYSLKAQGDRVYCGGINRVIYHRYAHQPWANPTYYPGMTMGQWGTHFERTLTWWKQSTEWLKYQARCQYLLQEGQFVADAIFFCGEDAPNGMSGSMPNGYDFDSCATAVLRLMSVKDGKIVLPSGMTYRMLVLPDTKTMTPETLDTIGKLVVAGATVVGPKPERAPGLSNYPAADQKVKELAENIWEKGVLTCSVNDALKTLKVQPDFACADSQAQVTFIHRRDGETDMYFVAQPKMVGETVSCSFRVSGKVPEFWHPDTGVIERAPQYTEADGITTLPIAFAPAGSMFVVFRTPETGDHAIDVKATITGNTGNAQKIVHDLKIVKAEYGVFGETEMPQCMDVTKKVQQQINALKGKIPASNVFFGKDPALNVAKELKIEYTVNGQKKTARAEEHQSVSLPENANVTKALYGIIDDEPAPAQAFVDITDKLNKLIKDGTLLVQLGNEIAGKDPLPMTVKESRVSYLLDGKPMSAKVGENGVLSLPVLENVTIPPPDYELATAEDGSITVQAWKPLHAEVKTAAGKEWRAKIADVPAPQAVEGAWTLKFPPNWGAPEQVTLEKLISWTDHADAGVKYFSGTATYVKTCSLHHAPAGNERIILDLGSVKNFAEVEVNGIAYPVLWKPPFRVDITEAAKKRSGSLAISVKVTNLWPNRLIGDEQLPDDREWNGIQLKEIPQWVKDGKKSPTGRFTFTTWHHWTKEDLPLDSGLIGPVFLRSVVSVRAK